MSSASVAESTHAHAAPKRSKFPQSFWVANTMEIFERLAWYGFFAVSSLYITGSRAEGALGFTSEQRGVLQGIVPFILYLLPVVFGALADRFGYKKTFIVAYSVMVPAYYLLGKFTHFGTFFMAFLFVAVGAAIFKPVITGTVARTTDETNSSMGFGIFYMMVNIGGFIGPIVAGFVRVRYGWDWVFAASAFWIACNFIWLFVFYKEPTTEAESGQKRSIKQVLTGIVEVLGNGRFFIMVFGLLLMLMLSGRVLSWGVLGVLAGGWVLLNFLVDIPLRARERRGVTSEGLLAPMKLGNWKFALYLLILSGFWTSFNQIFLTHPEFIRDYVDTSDMVKTARSWFGDDFARNLAVVNEDQVQVQVGSMINAQASRIDERVKAIQDGAYLAAFDTIPGNERAVTLPPKSLKVDTVAAKPVMRELWGFNLRVPNEVFAGGVGSLPLRTLRLDPVAGSSILQALHGSTAEPATKDTLLRDLLYQQTGVTVPVSDSISKVNPAERVISLTVAAQIDSIDRVRPLNERQMTYLLAGVAYADPNDVAALTHSFADQYRQVNPEYIINVDAGAIVIFQVLVSWLIGFIAPLTAMVIGIIIAAVGIGMAAWTYTGWLVTLAITIFAFGEMAASPKSQEYVGRIAPKQKVAMYMGFYFWTVALGNIFGGLLSGQLYGSLARDLGRPDIMWMIFGGLGLLTAFILILYDRLIIGGGKME
jgi:dipeptide/tripeptide permease